MAVIKQPDQIVYEDAEKRQIAETFIEDTTGQVVTRGLRVEWKSGVEFNRQDIQAKAIAALGVNATFLGLASPTNAQVVTQVQRLTRECNGLIRLLLDRLDDTSGT